MLSNNHRLLKISLKEPQFFVSRLWSLKEEHRQLKGFCGCVCLTEFTWEPFSWRREWWFVLKVAIPRNEQKGNFDGKSARQPFTSFCLTLWGFSLCLYKRDFCLQSSQRNDLSVLPVFHFRHLFWNAFLSWCSSEPLSLVGCCVKDVSPCENLRLASSCLAAPSQHCLFQSTA